jgi:AsmA protein
VVRNDDLVASSPLLRAAGRGSADLPEQTMDYRVDTTLVATIEGQSGRSLEDLRGVNLPIRITGAFAEPRFRLDLEDVVRERVDERVRRETDRLQQRLLERLGVGDSDGPDGSNAREAEPFRFRRRR